MPLINISLAQGRSEEQLRDLIHEVTEATVHAIDAPKENVRVIINQVPPAHWAAGDVTLEERKANKNDNQ